MLTQSWGICTGIEKFVLIINTGNVAVITTDFFRSFFGTLPVANLKCLGSAGTPVNERVGPFPGYGSAGSFQCDAINLVVKLHLNKDIGSINGRAFGALNRDV